METRTSNGRRSTTAPIVFLTCLALCVCFFGCGSDSQQTGHSERGSYESRGREHSGEDVDRSIKLPDDPNERAIIGVRYIAFGMLLFKSHLGRLPTEEEGIKAMYEEPETIQGQQLWRGPYNDASIVEVDPWGNPYQYRIDSSFGLGFEVWSTGPDGLKSDDDITASEHAGLPSSLGQGQPLFRASAGAEDDHQHYHEPQHPVPVPGDANVPH